MAAQVEKCACAVAYAGLLSAVTEHSREELIEQLGMVYLLCDVDTKSEAQMVRAAIPTSLPDIAAQIFSSIQEKMLECAGFNGHSARSIRARGEER